MVRFVEIHQKVNTKNYCFSQAATKIQKYKTSGKYVRDPVFKVQIQIQYTGSLCDSETLVRKGLGIFWPVKRIMTLVA